MGGRGHRPLTRAGLPAPTWPSHTALSASDTEYDRGFERLVAHFEEDVPGAPLRQYGGRRTVRGRPWLLLPSDSEGRGMPGPGGGGLALSSPPLSPMLGPEPLWICRLPCVYLASPAPHTRNNVPGMLPIQHQTGHQSEAFLPV